MSAVAGDSVGAALWRRLRDRAAWTATTDFFLILVAIVLPWSTSLVAIFVVAALATMAPFFDRQAFLQSLKRPASAAGRAVCPRADWHVLVGRAMGRAALRRRPQRQAADGAGPVLSFRAI